MGSKVGHVAPGSGFLIIGLWHLFNNIILFSLNPKTYRSQPWFPAPKLRHLELLLIAGGAFVSIAMELFLGPARHQPLDPDFTIPSNHLHNFDHASISLSFAVYAALAAALDRVPRPAAAMPLTLVAAAVAFGQELLLFHLHSADHLGLEGHYHSLLQLVIFVSLTTTLLGISHPCSFVVALVRSTSIAFRGVWFIFLGYALWTPALIPKGCFMNDEDGHFVVRCHSDGDLQRAKSLANLEFSWLVSAALIFSMLCFLFLSRRFGNGPEYYGTPFEQEELHDLELRKKINSMHGESDSLVFVAGKGDELSAFN